MKTKIILVFCITLMVTLLATSCQGIFGGDGDDKTPNTSGGAYQAIIVESMDIDVNTLRSGVMDKQGPIAMTLDSEPAKNAEIVIGNTNRDITARAKAELEALISKDADAEVGYIIYSYGASVAVYWTNSDMSTMALADFVKICINEKSLVLTDGVVHSELYDASEYAAERDWLALKAVCDPDVYSALRSLSSYYDPDRLLGWFANLWDDEIGAFYFSISARDNEPYLPDIESTNQALGWLSNNNFIDSQNEDIPHDIKVKVVAFAKSLQSSRDGYFYHPQWGQTLDQLQPDRSARDLGWSTGIIKKFTIDTDGDGIEEEQYPNYCAPDGIKCEEHDGTSERCSFITFASSLIDSSSVALTSSVCSGVDTAVSRVSRSTVVATASTRPDFSSAATFRAWLVETNSAMGRSSGNAHVINALRAEIAAHGYAEILLDFLDEKQQEIYDLQIDAGETPTGLWQYTYTYNMVWGLLKFTPFYNDTTYGRELKYAEEIVDSCMEIIMLDASVKYQANDIYNMWQGMQALFDNVKKYHPENLPKLQEKLRERGAELIDSSAAKLAVMKRTDGAFSMYSSGISQSTIYGAPIAMGVEEGDVNATVLLCSMYRCMFTCLGYTPVHLGNASRGAEFFELLSEVEPIVKNPAKKPTTITFDDGKTVGTLDNQSGNATLTFVDDDELEPGNTVLKFSSQDASASSTFGDGVTFKVEGNGGANCLVVESDIKIASTSAGGDIIQIRLGDYYRIRLHKSGNNIKLTEMLEVTGAATPNSIVIGTVGEWFKLRIECYKSDDEYDTPRFKIFVEDECVLISENAYGVNSTVVDYSSQVLFRSYKSVASDVLLDNCFFYNQDKLYNELLDDTSDIRDQNQ
ncbi:MAG: hypothetical protein IJW03_03395 [Clostridia bacterium]|nr:hypothetical protein [Clostridia bacterium]